MYIKVNVSYRPYFDTQYRWLLFSHTGLVMARSDQYRRHCDASRVGKQVATKLQIAFKGDL